MKGRLFHGYANLKYNSEFVLHNEGIYVSSVLHMNSGLTFSVMLLIYYYYYYYYYCAGDKIEKNEMGWSCGAYG